MFLVQVSAWAQSSPEGSTLKKGTVAEEVRSEDRATRGDSDRGDEEEEEQVRLSDRAELDRIIELYMAGEYETCSNELGAFLDPENPSRFRERAIVERGRLYFASCSLLEGRRTEARKALRDALEANPLMPSPDSLTFPPPVVSLFLEVRDEVQQLIAESEQEQVSQLRRENELAKRRAEARARRERELEKLAREEVVVQKNSRAIASLPFGIGQFQNRDRALGVIFATTETLLLATAVTSGIVMNRLAVTAAKKDVEIDPHNDNMRTAFRVLTGSSWALVGVMAVGVLDAHLRFKPEIVLRTRERKLPKELENLDVEVDSDNEQGAVRIEPTVGFFPGGGQVGFRGTF